MHLLISCSGGIVSIDTDLDFIDYDSFFIYIYGIEKRKLIEYIENSGDKKMQNYLWKEEIEPYLIIIHDSNTNEIKVFNDFFGSNQIFYFKHKDIAYITSDIFLIENYIPKIKSQSVYEMVVFQGILPPETIYDSVYVIPSGSFLIMKKNFLLEEYINVDDFFENKNFSYEKLIEDGREALFASLRRLNKKNTAIALSGGVDSGGLLGMMTNIHGESIKTISLGGRGQETFDLESARKSISYHKADSVEIYPVFDDLKKLPAFTNGLNQPVSASSLFVYSLIHDKANEIGSINVVYGLGAEMLLGNLRLSKIAYLLRYEKYIPRKIREFIYKIFVKLTGKNETHIKFLMAQNWVERFMYTRAVHYVWEKNFFTKKQCFLWDSVLEKIKLHYNPNLEVTDSIVKLYLKSWVNYLQMRDLTSIGKRTCTKPIMPFDTINLAKVFLSTPVQHRKKNKWNKQLIRDIMKPYVPNHLFSNAVRSLIVPYNELFKGHEAKIFKYLKTSSVVETIFDLKKLESEYHNLPEGGLFVFHILGIAVWYDENFHPENIKEFNKIFLNSNLFESS
jgi:asparagine synthetase B (glutamine-hydrolysing)